MPGTPRLYLGAVDVRDVAGMQVKAMTDPAAAGQRFLAVAGGALSMFEMAEILRAGTGRQGARRRSCANCPTGWYKLVAIFNPLAREAVPRLGIRARRATPRPRPAGLEIPFEREVDRRFGRKPVGLGDRK